MLCQHNSYTVVCEDTDVAESKLFEIIMKQNITLKPTNNNSTPQTVFRVQKIKKKKTPPESLNFLDTLRTVRPKAKTSFEEPSIYQLNEEGNLTDQRSLDDWDNEYEYEITESEGRLEKLETSPTVYESITIDNFIKTLTTKKPTKSTSLTFVSRRPIKFITKKHNPKFQRISKFRNVNRQTTKSKQLIYSNLNQEATSPLTELKEKFTFPFTAVDLTRDVQNPTSKHNLQNYQPSTVDQEHIEIVVEEKDNPTDLSFGDFFEDVDEEDKKIKIDVDFDDAFHEMENDEDYVPSTEDYEEFVFNVTLTPKVITTTESTLSSITSTKDINTNLTRFTPSSKSSSKSGVYTFSIPIRRRVTNKYPNPYKNGTIYFYYDCEDLIDSATGISTFGLFNFVTIISNILITS